MNAYESRVETRRDRLQSKADRATRAANRLYAQAREMSDAIPFGQPILVGHHSEGRDRNYRRGIDSRMSRSCAEAEKAQHYARRAAAVGTGGVSSDDPEAIDKLQAELAERKAKQEHMKRANALVRRKDAVGLADMGLSPAAIAGLLKMDETGNAGYPAYRIRNNGANIRRIEARMRELAHAGEQKDREEEGNGYTYREDVGENRVMLAFEVKPGMEIHKMLKSYGFQYSFTRGAYVRKLNANGKYAAQQARKVLDVQQMSQLGDASE
ncbi:conserved hypothetical protein [Paraburkholderia tropica]|uniref:DUF3560 domain-containing protein n=1 Tax=Paraburkholderia tropica TaxID=92647 RepID=UPI001CB17F48|nr:DUF3560 domain-containing protein [Paraburkholderia tropica]CAG9236919.1 conserved hypothetical protein [Paraburkholderia tropica]